MANSIDARELQLYGENDSSLYTQRQKPIEQNLLRKMRAGTYSSAAAVKAWRYWADDAAKRYTKEFGTPGPHGSFGTFDASTRDLVARSMRDGFEAEVRNGEHGSITVAAPKRSASKRTSTRRGPSGPSGHFA